MALKFDATRRQSMTLEVVRRHEKLAPASGVEFMAPISGAGFWSVCQGPDVYRLTLERAPLLCSWLSEQPSVSYVLVSSIINSAICERFIVLRAPAVQLTTNRAMIASHVFGQLRRPNQFPVLFLNQWRIQRKAPGLWPFRWQHLEINCKTIDDRQFDQL